MNIDRPLMIVSDYARSEGATTAPSLKDVGKAIAILGRAQRLSPRKISEFQAQVKETVFKKLIATNLPQSRMIAREMIRRDVLPAEWTLSQLAEAAGQHREMTEYLSTLKNRLDKHVSELEGEEILRLTTNEFTKRVLQTGQQDKWKWLQTDEALAKANCAKKISAKHAKQHEYQQILSKASRGGMIEVHERVDLARQYGRIPHSRRNIWEGHKHDAIKHDSTTVVFLSPKNRTSEAGQLTNEASHDAHSLYGGTPHVATNTNAGEPSNAISPDPFVAPLGAESETIGAQSPEGGETPPTHSLPLKSQEDVAGEMHDCLDVRDLSVTANLDYKANGKTFHFLQRRPSDRISEAERFQKAAEAVIELINMPGKPGEAPVFRNIPDLLHRVFSEETYAGLANEQLQKALGAIRDGLSGNGRQLPATAQKLLVWMAIISDPKCLTIDDPAKVTMQQTANGTFEVKEIAPDGTDAWRPAGDGTLDVAYTKSLIAHWFDNPKDVRFHDGLLSKSGAIRNIRVKGSLYESRDGNVELSPALSISMGKHRFRALGQLECLNLYKLIALREQAEARCLNRPLRLNIDLDHLPSKPVNLGNLTEILWNDKNGNSARELYALCATGMIQIVGQGETTSQSAWQQIREAIARDDFQLLYRLMTLHIERGPNAAHRTFVLSGATLVDRDGNDLSELQVRHFLRTYRNIDLREIYSTQNRQFNRSVLANRDRLPDVDQSFDIPGEGGETHAMHEIGSSPSLEKMQALLNSTWLATKSDARQRLETYLPVYFASLVLYHVADDGHTLYSNGSSCTVIADALEAQARHRGIKIPVNGCAAEKGKWINKVFRDELIGLCPSKRSGGKVAWKKLPAGQAAYEQYLATDGAV